MQTRDALAEVYRKLDMIGERLGPHIICDERQLRKLFEQSRALFQKASSECEQIDGRRWRVPSAYHALMILHGAGEALLRENPDLRPILRGQSQAFDPLPYFFRPGTDREVEEHAAEMFCSLLERLLHGGQVSKSVRKSYLAIAQHYGIKTRLLDFTMDPAVAVFFAAKNPPKSPHAEAVIYFLPFRSVWNSGCRIYLVPAFAERIYLQRGLFVEVPEAEVETFRRSCVEISFPHDPTYCVMRQGHNVDILREDPWLASSIGWCRERAAQGESVPEAPEEQVDFWYTAFQKLGYPSFAYADANSKAMSIAKWIDDISDLLYWLVLTIKDQQEILDGSALEKLVQDNGEALLEFVDVYELEARHFENTGQYGRAAGRKRLSQLIRQSVSKKR